MKVLVTGSEGLIGKSLVQQLEEREDKVARFDIAIDSHFDILSANSCRNQFNYESPNLIIHLAAQSGVEPARGDARGAWMLNVFGTLNVLEAARLYHIPVVAASSNHVYGPGQELPTPETAPLNQLDTYSATKIATDVLVRSYWHNYGLPTAVVRNTNCYGPDSPHVDHLIEGAILAAMSEEDFQLRTDGEVKKGYLYVDDAASAYICVGDALLNGDITPGEAFNASTGALSARELARTVYEHMGNHRQRVLIGNQHHDQSDEELDDSKLRALGWRERVWDGLDRTITAFRERYTVKV